MVELMETHRKGPNKCHPNLKSQNNEVTNYQKAKRLLKKKNETYRNLRPSRFAAGKLDQLLTFKMGLMMFH